MTLLSASAAALHRLIIHSAGDLNPKNVLLKRDALALSG